MNKSIDNAIKEDILSAYIDSLNDEVKPVDFNEDDIDDGMLQLFETVKAVKRLKNTDAEAFLINNAKLKNKRGFNNFIKIAASIAAVFVIFISSLAIKGLINGNMGKKSGASTSGMPQSLLQNKSDQNSTADASGNYDAAQGGQNNTAGESRNYTIESQNENKAVTPEAGSASKSTDANRSNTISPSIKSAVENGVAASQSASVTYKMEVAYNSLSSYLGEVEIKEIKNGKIVSDETVSLTYKKPDKYITVETINGTSKKEYCDGEKLCTIEGSKVTVDYVYPVKDLWRYNIEEQIQELKQASDIREDGSEILSGRETQIYEYKFSGNEKYNRIWVDKKTNLPLKREVNTAGGTIINEFKQLEINNKVDDSSFTYNIKIDDEVCYLNEKVTRSEAEETLPLIKNIINNVPEYLKLQKTIKLQNNLYGYYISFQNDSKAMFLDIYVSNIPVTGYYIPGDAHGSLLDGWTESEVGAVNVLNIYNGKSNTVKWVGKNYEVVLVSNTDTGELLKILEDSSNSKITSISEEELNKMGIKPKS